MKIFGLNREGVEVDDVKAIIMNEDQCKVTAPKLVPEGCRDLYIPRKIYVVGTGAALAATVLEMAKQLSVNSTMSLNDSVNYVVALVKRNKEVDGPRLRMAEIIRLSKTKAYEKEVIENQIIRQHKQENRFRAKHFRKL